MLIDTSGPRGKARKRSTLGGKEVKVQGHVRLKQVIKISSVRCLKNCPPNFNETLQVHYGQCALCHSNLDAKVGR